MTARAALRVTALCPHFAPDVAPTGDVITRIAEELAARGHRLHVVTSVPWYREHRIEAGWEGRAIRHEDVAWGRVTRVHPFPTDKADIRARALAFGGFTVLATLGAALGRTRPDVVLAMSPPLTLGLAGWLVARARRAPFVFNVQDVFPDVAVELGLLRDRRLIATAERLERLTYARADAVTVLSEDLADNVRAKLARGRGGGGTARVRVIPNFVDTERVRPADRDNDYRRQYGLVGRTVVMYAGNVGFSQSLDVVLDAAVAMRDEPRLVFVVNGGGAARPQLEQRARAMANVVFVDMQPVERLAEVLAAADIHLVPLKRGLGSASVPSKLYSILAAGRPLVASVDPGTEVARVVERAGAGLTVAPDDVGALTAALARLVAEPDEAAAMGVAGRAFVEQWVSPAAVAEAYEALFHELLGAVARRGRGREGTGPVPG